MGLSIEELYAFKASYDEQIAELERKKQVVDEFIAFAEAKEPVAEETDNEVVYEEEVTAEEV